MNRVEVFNIKDVEEIEYTVNSYCVKNGLDPISISVTEIASHIPYIVTVVVKPW